MAGARGLAGPEALAGARGLAGPIGVAGPRVLAGANGLMELGALAGANGLKELGALAGANGLANSTRSAKADTLVFVWWNLQNLFDTVANSGPRDRDFLPDGPYRWDSKRYYAKLYAVGRGLAAAAGGRIPDAIGVCEVENADVLYDLEGR